MASERAPRVDTHCFYFLGADGTYQIAQKVEGQRWTVVGVAGDEETASRLATKWNNRLTRLERRYAKRP